MSDFTELMNGLFNPGKDPKELTPKEFVDKEAQNLKNAIVRLPTAVQPFLDVTVETAQGLADAALPLAGQALGALVAQEAPVAEQWFLSLLGKAFGASGVAAINAAAQTPAGQATIAQLGAAAQAALAHLEASASAGALSTSVQPSAPSPATPPPVN